MKRVLVAIGLAISLLLPVMAIGGGVASASQEVYKFTTVGDGHTNVFWLGDFYSGDLLQYEQIQFQSGISDAWTMSISSPANTEGWGPVVIGPGDQWFEIDEINALWAVPGYSAKFTWCEFDVACWSKTLTLFNILSDN